MPTPPVLVQPKFSGEASGSTFLLQHVEQVFAGQMPFQLPNQSSLCSVLISTFTGHCPVYITVRVLLKWLNKSSWILAWELCVQPILHCLIRKFGYLQNKGTSVRLCPSSGLRKFCHGKLITSLTKLVHTDSRACWWHLYDNRRVVAAYYKSVNSNPLTLLLRFVVDSLYNLFYCWQDFDWHSTPRGASAVAQFLVNSTIRTLLMILLVWQPIGWISYKQSTV